jgi:adenylosuccinate lyase
MATENILMEAVKKGGDRQILHEQIRVHSMEAAKQVKEYGKPNDLLERITNDPSFNLSKKELGSLLNVKNFTGRAAQQTEEFITNHIVPRITIGKSLGTLERTDPTV